MSLQKIWNTTSRKRKFARTKKLKEECSGILATSLVKPESPIVIEDLCQYCSRPEPKLGEMMANDPALSTLEVIGRLGTNESAVVHYCCVFFARGLRQLDPPTMEQTFGFRASDIAKNLEKCSKTRCHFCKKMHAAASCNRCGLPFHFPCGTENGVMFDYEKFIAYCPKHCPQQTPDVGINMSFSSFDSKCLICQDEVLCEPGFGQHRSACCNHWFHRSCLQQYAFAAASAHLKCPLCNDVNSFRQELLRFGFHVPLRDAAWEQDPENFRQMYEIGFVCYAKTCICPHGRSYDGGLTSIYDHLVCCVCGNNAVHRSCSVTAWLNEKWVCVDCDPDREPDSGDEEIDDISKYL